MPGSVFRQNFDIAISAPVLPAEIAASASPRFTASIAHHIEDTRRPDRSATLGFSSIAIATSVCRTSEASFSFGWRARCSFSCALSPKNRNFVAGRRSHAIAAPSITTAGP